MGVKLFSFIFTSSIEPLYFLKTDLLSKIASHFVQLFLLVSANAIVQKIDHPYIVVGDYH